MANSLSRVDEMGDGIYHDNDAIGGKTLGDLFGPFSDVYELSASSKCHEVKLHGKLVSKVVPTPNPLTADSKKRFEHVKCRSKKRLLLGLEVETSKGQTNFPLIAFYDAVTRLEKKFVEGEMYIICGVNIQKFADDFNNTNHEYQGVLDKTFVHRMSPRATLKTLASDELPPLEKGQIPLINIRSDNDWPISKFIQGEIMFKEFDKQAKRLSITIRDATATLRMVAFKSVAETWKRRIHIDKKYRIFKGNGTIEEVSYSKTSLPVQLKMLWSTNIEDAIPSTKKAGPDMTGENSRGVKRKAARQTSSSKTRSSIKSLKRESRLVTPKELNQLSEHVGLDWRYLGRGLKISDAALDAINHDFNKDGLREIAYQMLKRWKEMTGSKATVGSLSTIFDEQGRQNAIESVFLSGT